MTPPRTAAAPAVLGACAALALLGACAAGPVADPAVGPVDPTPVVVDERAPTADVDPRALPEQLGSHAVASVGWDTMPLERDGIFLGMRAAESSDEPLQFVAADSTGTVRWRADRPAACTSFALSAAGDRTIAVLLDTTSTDQDVAAVSATAYDLATGEQVWGPVDVPGPLVGPGLVFAGPAPEAAVGETGPRTVLDPATGQVLVSERDEAGTTVVGEYDGVVLTAADGRLHARDTGGEARWTRPLSAFGIPGDDVAAVAGVAPPPGTALVGADGAGTGTLIDTDGNVVAPGVQDARRDPASSTLVTRAGTTVTGYPAHGEQWTRMLDGDVELAGVGGVLAYVMVDGAVQVLNAVTGRDSVSYREDHAEHVAVPELFGSDGGVVVRLEELHLVTNRAGT